MGTRYKMIISVLLTICFLSGCSKKNELSFQEIPNYPAASEGQNMEGSTFGGIMGGELKQLFTTDPFDRVVEFYSDELDKYNPETISHESELGRQTAITIKQNKQVITVAIQEHLDDNTVVISHMLVGGL